MYENSNRTPMTPLSTILGITLLSTQIINIQGRDIRSLDGDWKAFPDLYETGYYDYRRNPINERGSYFADRSFYADQTRLIEYDFDAARTLRVPGDWNTQEAKYYYYEGTMWYRQKFNAEPKEGKRSFVYFGAANYEAVVGLNGHVVGTHIGGYTPFNFEVTDLLKQGENSLIVKVDNQRHLEGVPTVNADWWNYGGLTRSVYLVETPETFIRDYFVQLAKGEKGKISGWVQLDGSRSRQNVTIEIPELKIRKTITTGDDGYAAFEFKASPELWCPENPKLYDVKIVSETDSVSDRIGFRTIETRGTDMLLNGKKIFCKGVCIHEEMPYPPSGRANSEEHARILLGWAKEMGCNFVRLAHYPHNEAMILFAEQMGIMVWDEIPVYWTIQWENPDTYANAENQLCEMIGRDKNRANVIIWSVSNETPPTAKGRLEFLTALINKAHSLDPTRLVSSAMEKSNLDANTMTVNDPLMHVADILSFNEYVGWYDGSSEKCDRISWTFPVEKPVIISEFGGGAKAGRHGADNERFTEEYMKILYEKNIAMFSRMPGLAGTTPWVLKDFRSPKRPLVGIQDDFNRKGLVSEDGIKKSGFYVMKEWYESME